MGKQAKRARDEHPFRRYYRKHGHFPRARIKMLRKGDPHFEALHNNPTVQYRVLECVVAPTHIEIRTSLVAHPLTIPIRELDTLIEWLLPLVAQMDRTSPPFDPTLNVIAQSQLEGEYRALHRQRSKRSPAP